MLTFLRQRAIWLFLLVGLVSTACIPISEEAFADSPPEVRAIFQAIIANFINSETDIVTEETNQISVETPTNPVVLSTNTQIHTQANPNDGGGNPNEECPVDTVQLAKFNYEGGNYVLEGNNDGGVVITGDETGGTWTSTESISHVLIKGANDVHTDTYSPVATSGSFDNSGIFTPNGQNNAAISNIKFCGPEEAPPELVDIRVIKYNDLNQDGTTDEIDLGPSGPPTGATLTGWTFELYDDQGQLLGTGTTSVENATNDLGVRVTFADLVKDATYTICEVEQAGWINTDPGINSDPGATGLSRPCETINTSNAGSIAIRYFGNYQPTGSITILKNVDDNSFADMDFDFVFNGSTNFSLSENGAPFVVSDLPAGNYTVTETVPSDWDLDMIDCGNGNNNTALANGLTIVLEAGEDAVCTFNNNYEPPVAIRVIKYNDLNQNGSNNEVNTGNSGGPTGNTLTGWDFVIYDSQGNQVDSGTTSAENPGAPNDLGIRVTFDGLSPSETYTVCEVEQSGWNNSDPGTLDGTYNAPCKSLDASGINNFAIMYFGNYEEPQPDLTAVKVNDTNGTGFVGAPFNWTITLANDGLGEATFADGEVIFRDNLPNGATYYPFPDTSNLNNLIGGFDCMINTNVLTCVALGSLTFQPGGSFDVSVQAAPTATGDLVNPTDGECTIDPDDEIVESNEDNNSCSDTVTVTEPSVAIRVIKYNDLDQNGSNNEVNTGSSGGPTGNTLTGWNFVIYDSQGNQVDSGTTSAENAGAPNDLGIRVTFNGLSPSETYTVCEIEQAGWINSEPGTLDGTYNVPCKTLDASGINNFAIMYFGNYQEMGSITILKNVDDDAYADMTFDFVFDGSTNFSLSENGAPFVVSDLPAGNYTVTETVPAEWDLDTIDCGNGNNNTALANGLTIVLEAGEEAVCTFNNVYTPPPPVGSITILKNVDDDSYADMSFDFVFDGSTNFSLSENGAPFVVSDLPAGNYTVTETVPSDWDLDTIDCGNGNNNTALANGLTIVLEAGEEAVCTFNNVYTPPPPVGSITILKNVDDDSFADMDFDFVFNGSTNFSLSENGTPYVVSDLPAGTYNVTENVPPGWDLTSIDCGPNNNTGATNGLNIVLEAGEDAVCTFNNINLSSSIDVIKTASVSEVTAPGGNVTFTFRIENTGSDTVTINSLTDTVFGDLNGQGACSVPQVIGIGSDYQCTLDTVVNGSGGDVHYNVVTASGVDSTNDPVSGEDDATVNIVAPLVGEINVTKTPSVSEVTAPGELVTFTFKIDNIGTDTVTIDSLLDTVFGDLDGQGTCSVPQVISVAGSYECSLDVFIAGDAGDSHYNVVTASGTDTSNNAVSDNDDATVNIVAPPVGSIVLTKSVNWNGVPVDSNQSFQLCIDGDALSSPQCQSVGANGGTVTFSDLPLGEYTAYETDPGSDWTVSGGGSVTLDAPDQQKSVTITNTHDIFVQALTLEATCPAGTIIVTNPNGFVVNFQYANQSYSVGANATTQITAQPGETVTITFDGGSATATAKVSTDCGTVSQEPGLTCPANWTLIGESRATLGINHPNLVLEASVNFNLSDEYEDYEVSVQVASAVGHPENGCLIGGGNDGTKYPCDQGQNVESFNVLFDGSQVANIPDHGEDQWQSFGTVYNGTIGAGSHTVTYRHVGYGPTPESVTYKSIVCVLEGTPAQTQAAEEEAFQSLEVPLSGDVTETSPTEAPPTEAPPTEAPPTEAPPTEAPPTEAPPTEAPPTEAPPTEAPPTEAPPTEAPPTEAPPTEAPPTEAPPADEAPPTEAPPTEAPPAEEA